MMETLPKINTDLETYVKCYFNQMARSTGEGEYPKYLYLTKRERETLWLLRDYRLTHVSDWKTDFEPRHTFMGIPIVVIDEDDNG